MKKSETQKWPQLESLNGEKPILLHACCAPCSGAIVECMLQEGLKPVVFYSNSNIFPLKEYEIRRDECMRYASANGLEFVEDEYNHEDWINKVAKGLEDAPERGGRCLRCFKYRLSRAAKYASEHNLRFATTTLASSRWKSQEQIDCAGEYACENVENVEWWAQNWRKGGLQERRSQIIKEQNFYNQSYCGCEYSMSKLTNNY